MVRSLVLVHGLDSSSAEWDDLVETLGSGVAVTRVDLPQHGARSHETFHLGSAIGSIVDAITTSTEPAVVVGRGLGAHLAIAALSSDAVSGASVAGVVALGIGTETLGWVADSHRIASGITGTMRDRPGTLHVDALDEIAGLDTRAGLRRVTAPFVLVNGSNDRFRFQERALVKAAAQGRLVRVPGAAFGDRMSSAAQVAEIISDLA